MEVKNINDRLLQYRTLIGIAQKEFSDKLGVKQSYLSDIENSRRNVSNKLIEKVCQTFPLEKNWLYTGIGNMITLNKSNVLYPNLVPPTVPLSKEQYFESIEKDFLWTDEQYENHKKNTQARLRKLMENEGILELEFHKRLLTDIIQNHSKINGLQSELNDLRIFKYIIENLNHYYFSKVDLQLNSVSKFLINGKFNYEDYKAAYLAEFEKLEQIQPALHKISAAIKQFYKDIEAFDTENIVKGYFGESTSNEPIK